LPATFIENDRLRVGVSVDYGARVVSLLDKRGGREWMTSGGQSPDTGEEARYGSAEAVGWDECFPTVSRWDAGATPWGRNLRDHGDLWGRPWQVEAQGPQLLTTSYADRQFRFTRTLRLEGATLIAAYAAENLTGEPLPYLWALHALLAIRRGDRIELGGLESVWSVFSSLDGIIGSAGPVNWTEPTAGRPFAFAEVQPPSTTFMGKFYSAHRQDGSARVGQPGAHLDFAWSENIAHLGIWITYGAWPAPGGHHEVALEPTNAPSDHVGQTIADGYPPLASHERRDWWVRLTVTD
jgi:galactose mutarotase-like enzyme